MRDWVRNFFWRIWCKLRGKPFYKIRRMKCRLFVDGVEIPIVKCTITFREDTKMTVIRLVDTEKP